jgi:hypothetical protein
MANEWLRLWHDMPTDPKFKTVARVSGQPISLVISVYLHLLVSASRNVTRGHADVTEEDIASALDVTEDEINPILEAMQGRLLDGTSLTGWEKRQPKKEDVGRPETGAMSAAERKRLQREREKFGNKNNNVTDSHDESRNVTTDKDKDKDKELKHNVIDPADRDSVPVVEVIELFNRTFETLPEVKVFSEKRKTAVRRRWKENPKLQTLESWEHFFDWVKQSNFLMGRTEKPWTGFCFDWLFNPTNFAKIIEGNYHRGQQ